MAEADYAAELDIRVKVGELERWERQVPIELRVNDHTPGFDWPQKIKLPVDQSERGRGLYLIRKIMDSASYLRGRGQNSLVMCKRRSAPSPGQQTRPDEKAERLQRRLVESEQVVQKMAEELSSCYESLSAIFRYNAELGKTLDLEDFVRCLA